MDVTVHSAENNEVASPVDTVTIDGALEQNEESSAPEVHTNSQNESDTAAFVQSELSSPVFVNDNYTFEVNEQNENTDPNVKSEHVSEKPTLPPKPDNLAPVRSISVTDKEE